MPTYTTTYSLGKPVVGADEDAWGDTLNASLDSIDDILDGTTPVTGIDINSGTLDGVTIGGTTAGAGTFTTLTANTSITGTLATAAQPNITSVGTLTGLTVSASASLAGASTTADITFGDNDKAIFGAGSDLQIYHSGFHSYVQDAGTGDLIMGGSSVYLRNIDATPDENMAVFNTNGSVDLYYDNAKKLATTSTGVDITGTVTADEVSGQALRLDRVTSGNNIDINVYNPITTAGIITKIRTDGDGISNAYGALSFHTTRTPDTLLQRMRIDSQGDISFYEDTGTTAKFFWDASAESLGIGTSSPQRPLHVDGAEGVARFTSTASGNNGFEVGIGASSQAFLWQSENSYMQFATNATERMRIDSSGNLLVGTTDSIPWNNSAGSSADNGFAYRPEGILSVAGYNTQTMILNRTGTDGDIVQFRKDGTTVGSIGRGSSSRLIINGDSNGIAFERSGTEEIRIGSNVLQPSDDNDCDLGLSFRRFKDIYATNGTIQTSDRNEKQDIEELSDAEQRVAVAAKGLLRKFRWRDAVEEKGDEARTHFGIIAQDLQAAFEAEGLDAGDYAMFIHSTWTDEETGEERSRMGVRYSELLAFIIAAI